MLRNKTILLCLFCVLLSGVKAQNSVSSPFSRLGYGFLETSVSARSLAMGRVGVGVRSGLYINTINPASYTSIDSLSHIFEFGISGRFSQFDEGDVNTTASDVNFQSVAMAFPVTSWMGVVAAIQPVSYIGYERSGIATVAGTSINYQTNYSGKGGLSKILLGVGISPVKNLSVGINANYIFGPLDYNRSVVFLDNSANFNLYSSTKASVYGFQFAFGAQYNIAINESKTLTIGGTYEPKVELNSEFIDVVTSVSDDTVSHRVDYPQAYSFGLSLKNGHQWCLGVDFYAQQWSSVGLNSSVASSQLRDRINMAFGGELLPDFNSRSYFKRVSYRLGAHYGITYMKDVYQTDGLSVNEDVVDLGINFGVGLPLRYSKTTFNIGVELGKLGALQNSSLKEQYARVILSCTLHDVWFFKRQFE